LGPLLSTSLRLCSGLFSGDPRVGFVSLISLRLRSGLFLSSHRIIFRSLINLRLRSGLLPSGRWTGLCFLNQFSPALRSLPKRVVVSVSVLPNQYPFFPTSLRLRSDLFRGGCQVGFGSPYQLPVPLRSLSPQLLGQFPSSHQSPAPFRSPSYRSQGWFHFSRSAPTCVPVSLYRVGFRSPNQSPVALRSASWRSSSRFPFSQSVSESVPVSSVVVVGSDSVLASGFGSIPSSLSVATRPTSALVNISTSSGSSLRDVGGDLFSPVIRFGPAVSGGQVGFVSLTAFWFRPGSSFDPGRVGPAL
jgi:hypothetical protein